MNKMGPTSVILRHCIQRVRGPLSAVLIAFAVAGCSGINWEESFTRSVTNGLTLLCNDADHCNTGNRRQR